MLATSCAAAAQQRSRSTRLLSFFWDCIMGDERLQEPETLNHILTISFASSHFEALFVNVTAKLSEAA